MALANAHKRKRGISLKSVVALLIVVALCCSLTLVAVNQAQGSGEVDSSTIGVGTNQATSDSDRLSAAHRISGSSAQQVSGVPSEASDPTDAAQRSITVKDPDPVVVPVAVDETNPEAVSKASEVCTLDPLPTAPRVAPDVNDGTWSSGSASGYNITTNDDGMGNFGVTNTSSGIALTDNSITVAVPESQSYLLGRIVEICYDGKVVIATVTDTGGFARYGRALDLAPGVYKAFGADSPSDWGVRTVYYRFL